MLARFRPLVLLSVASVCMLLTVLYYTYTFDITTVMNKNGWHHGIVEQVVTPLNKLGQVLITLRNTSGTQNQHRTPSINQDQHFPVDNPTAETIEKKDLLNSRLDRKSFELQTKCPWESERPPQFEEIYNTSITLWGMPKSSLPVSAKHGVITTKYLPNYRNPCWRDIHTKKTKLNCLPFLYQLGVTKGGTTDLYSQLVKHPLLEPAEKKELWYWFRTNRRSLLDSYIDYFDVTATRIAKDEDDLGCHHRITLDATPHYFAEHGYVINIPGNKNVTSREPFYTMPHAIYTLNPASRFLVTLRNPTDRLYSHYHDNYRTHYSPEEFHRCAVNAVKWMKQCLAVRSLRSCAFDQDLNEKMRQQRKIFIHSSLYYVYVKEWLSVFPRDQIMFVKAEEFYANGSDIMRDVFAFLGVGDPPPQV